MASAITPAEHELLEEALLGGGASIQQFVE
jgi:hypothetical protein